MHVWGAYPKGTSRPHVLTPSSQNLRNNGARLAQSWITVRVWRDFAHHYAVIQAKRAPLRQARTVTLGGGPKQYDTALTSEDGLWARK